MKINIKFWKLLHEMFQIKKNVQIILEMLE